MATHGPFPVFLGGLLPAASVVVHRLGRLAGHGVFLDLGLNACPLHWQVDFLSPSLQVFIHVSVLRKVN